MLSLTAADRRFCALLASAHDGRRTCHLLGVYALSLLSSLAHALRRSRDNGAPELGALADFGFEFAHHLAATRAVADWLKVLGARELDARLLAHPCAAESVAQRRVESAVADVVSGEFRLIDFD